MSQRKLLSISTPRPEELAFRHWLKDKFVGQPDAFEEAVQIFLAITNPYRDKTRPIRIVFLNGRSGHGKTYLFQLLAEYFHHDREAIHKLDMGEFKTDHQVTRLLGSPPSYVGQEIVALLSRSRIDASVGKSTYPVRFVLLDEIEKAHPDVHDVVLGALDTGVLTLNNNERVFLGDCVLCMTGNIGMEEVQRAEQNSLGFGGPQQFNKAQIRGVVEKRLGQMFRPEFLNRIDAIVVYDSFTAEQMNQVVDVQIGYAASRLMPTPSKRFTLFVENAAKDVIRLKALKRDGGARHLRRTVEGLLVIPLSQELLKGTVQPGSIVTVDAADGALQFFCEEAEATSLAALAGEAREITPAIQAARELVDEATGLINRAEFAAAEPLLLRALDAYEAHAAGGMHYLGHGHALSRLARQRMGINQGRLAVKCSRMALKIFTTLRDGDATEVAVELNNLATYLFAVGERKEAESAICDSLDMARRLGLRDLLRTAAGNLTHFYYKSRNEKALTNLVQWALDVK